MNSVVEFDTLEVGESQASISSCFENRRRDVSGIVAYDCLLIVGQNIGCVSRELVKGVDFLCGMEADGAKTMVTSGRKPISGGKGAGVERPWVVVEIVDDLVNEFWWDTGGHWWWKRSNHVRRELIRSLFQRHLPEKATAFNPQRQPSKQES